MLASLKSGDKVVTSSGIVGVVITVKDKTVSLRSADAKMEVTKSSVTEILERGGSTVRLLRPAMKNNNFWKFILVVFIICWSLLRNVSADQSRDLVKEFETRAENRDAAFTNILARAGAAAKGRDRTASSPICRRPSAPTTSSLISRSVDAKNQLYPNTFILNQLQRDASGKIKLGLDLQGGTAFLVEMDTNALAARPGQRRDQRRRHQRPDDCRRDFAGGRGVAQARGPFGVAEPVIQPAGGNQILIQLPGLSRGRQGKRHGRKFKRRRIWNSGW